MLSPPRDARMIVGITTAAKAWHPAFAGRTCHSLLSLRPVAVVELCEVAIIVLAFEIRVVVIQSDGEATACVPEVDKVAIAVHFLEVVGSACVGLCPAAASDIFEKPTLVLPHDSVVVVSLPPLMIRSREGRCQSHRCSQCQDCGER